MSISIKTQRGIPISSFGNWNLYLLDNLLAGYTPFISCKAKECRTLSVRSEDQFSISEKYSVLLVSPNFEPARDIPIPISVEIHTEEF